MSAQPTTTLGTKIVKETYTDLAGSPTVKRSVGNAQLNPEARIDRYLERLQRVLNREAKRSDSLAPHERLAERLIRNSCLDLSNSELVDKIARGIYDSERRAAYQQGHGANLEQLPYDQVKEDYIPLVREKHSAQRDTLSRWTDYLRKNDGHYPAWFRYLAVRGVLKMGEYNRDTPSFHKRTDTTIAPFPDLNSEALGLVFKILSEPEKLGEVLASFDLTNIEPLRAALATKRFANLYAVALRECNKSIDRSRLEGEWRKYDQGSDYTLLEQDLTGKGTGWCTARGSAKAHLEAGDFYVYYTKDSNEQFSVPRVAIRMANDKIAEMRGIAPEQEMEPDFVEIAEEKGKTLPGFERFKKASADMKRLTEIDKRCFIRDDEFKIVERLRPELTKEDLRFLYEIDSTIESFGHERDPRIEQNLEGRDTRADYAKLCNIDIRRVVQSKDDITEDIAVYIGDFSPDDYEILENRRSPLVIVGKTDLRGSKIQRIPEGIVFNGDVVFARCTSLQSIPEGTVFNGEAYFTGCTSLQSIPEGRVFNGGANFEGCTSLQSIPSGTVFNGGANFEGCTSLQSIAEGTVFNGEAYFARCTSLQSIPEGTVFTGGAYFTGCTSLQSIPEGRVFNGEAYFTGCTSLQSIPEGTVFNGDAVFEGCTSLQSIAEGTVFNGGANFAGCTSLQSIAEGTVFNGYAWFEGCTSLQSIAEGTVFNGYAWFAGCTSLQSIPAGTVFNGEAHLRGCTSLRSIHPSVIFKGAVKMEGCDESLRGKYEREVLQ